MSVVCCIVDWIRSAHEHTTYTTSVCTGALLLGSAGLLQGLQATTHWVAYDELRKYGAEPTEQRVVFQNKIVTGAGVSAGIDHQRHAQRPDRPVAVILDNDRTNSTR